VTETRSTGGVLPASRRSPPRSGCGDDPVAERTNERWLDELRSSGLRRERAAHDLATYLRKGLGRALGRDAGVQDADLEDFTQDALIRILDALDAFRGESRFTTWAMTIAIRTAYTALRKRRSADVSLSDIEGHARVVDQELLASPPNPPDGGVLRDDLYEALWGAITERLTDRQRTVILAEMKGVASERIAELLGSNRNAVYKVYHDARKNLRTALRDAGFTATDVRSILTEAE